MDQSKKIFVLRMLCGWCHSLESLPHSSKPIPITAAHFSRPHENVSLQQIFNVGIGRSAGGAGALWLELQESQFSLERNRFLAGEAAINSFAIIEVSIFPSDGHVPSRVMARAILQGGVSFFLLNMLQPHGPSAGVIAHEYPGL